MSAGRRNVAWEWNEIGLSNFIQSLRSIFIRIQHINVWDVDSKWRFSTPRRYETSEKKKYILVGAYDLMRVTSCGRSTLRNKIEFNAVCLGLCPFQCYRAVAQRLFVAASAFPVASGTLYVNGSAPEQAPIDWSLIARTPSVFAVWSLICKLSGRISSWAPIFSQGTCLNLEVHQWSFRVLTLPCLGILGSR